MGRGRLCQAVAAVLVLAACGSGGLKSDDPRGYDACSGLDKITGTGIDLTNNVALGLSASAATTKGIRDTAKATFSADALAEMRRANPKVEQIYFVDQEALRTACAAAGFEFKS